MKDYDVDFISATYGRMAEREARARRRRQTKKQKKRLRRMVARSSGMPCGARLVAPWDADGAREAFCVRKYRGRRSGYIKKLCNRKIRRSVGILLQRGQKNRFTEFWWEYL